MNTWSYISAIQGAFLLMHLIIAVGVYRDARRVEGTFGKELKIFDPVAWTALSFLGGLFALAIYAALHHTRLVKK
jgi:hypothetical protein